MFKLTEKLSEMIKELSAKMTLQPVLAEGSYVAKCDPCSGTCMGNCSGCYGCKGK